MSSVMKFSVVNAVVLLLLTVLTGVFYMKSQKKLQLLISMLFIISLPPETWPESI